MFDLPQKCGKISKVNSSIYKIMQLIALPYWFDDVLSWILSQFARTSTNFANKLYLYGATIWKLFIISYACWSQET